MSVTAAAPRGRATAHIVPRAVCAQQHPAPRALVDDGRREARVRRPARVRHQLDADEEPRAAHIANARVAHRRVGEPPQHRAAHGEGVALQRLVPQHLRACTGIAKCI